MVVEAVQQAQRGHQGNQKTESGLKTLRLRWRPLQKELKTTPRWTPRDIAVVAYQAGGRHGFERTAGRRQRRVCWPEMCFLDQLAQRAADHANRPFKETTRTIAQRRPEVGEARAQQDAQLKEIRPARPRSKPTWTSSRRA